MLRSAHVFNILSECAAFAQYFKRMMIEHALNNLNPMLSMHLS
jgi:hypothetical protein